MALALAGCLACQGSDEAAPAGVPADSVATAFLAGHWAARPIPAQGPPPATFDSLARDLAPETCGICHPAQYRDWSTTVHAASFSPGLAGQLAAWHESDPATVTSCMACHGPLAEQLRRVEQDGAWVDNPVYDPALEAHGVTCAACHVRGWRRYGPPRRDGSLDPAPAGAPHGGAIRSAAFEDARFCAPCHQFEEPAPEGKPLENTVREWQASSWAARGVSCQSCHMPDRRHLWRGIHDPETTRAAITPSLEFARDAREAGFVARLTVVNSGAGHHFPTYVTPAVDLEIAFLSGEDTLGSRRRTLQRVVVWEAGDWREVRDDRIPAGGSAALAWTGPIPPGADRLVATIRVRPDAFYTDLFGELLAAGSPRDPGREAIEEALRRTLASPYELWREVRPWPDPVAPAADS